MKKIWIVLSAVCLWGCIQSITSDPADFSLNLIHTNDLHSHLLPFNDLNDCDLDSDCLGGLARITTFLKKEKSEKSAGDPFSNSTIDCFCAADRFSKH